MEPKKYLPKQGLMKSADIKKWVRSILPKLEEPSAYLGNEINSVHKKWDDMKVRMAEGFVVPYADAISNIGVPILYNIVNSEFEDACMERFYFPDKRMYKLMQKNNVPFFTLESKHALKDFDFVGFSCFYSIQYFNLVRALYDSGIQIRSADRAEDDPIVLMGGVSAYNPEPIYNVPDIICVGEGEDQMRALVKLMKERKETGMTREEFLYRAATEIQGCYVPKYYDVSYREDGYIENIFPLRDDVPFPVKKGVANMESEPPLTKMFVPNIEGGSLGIGSVEIARGCGANCRFCQAGQINKPYRERDLDVIKTAFEDICSNTGTVKVTPYCFNIGYFSRINELMEWLLMSEDRTISMSSQRIDLYNAGFAQIAKMSGNRSITFAIEAGSQRMRDAINKNITEEQIIEAYTTAFKLGVNKIKTYMIANLPFETEEDRFAIIPLMQKILAIRDELGSKCQVRISYTPFEAKPWTALQWAENFPKERNLDKVVAAAKEIGLGFRVGTPGPTSIIDQVISRGDRRLAEAIITCAIDDEMIFYSGLKFQGKDPVERFEEVLKALGTTMRIYQAEQPADAILPWEIISIGVSKKYLRQEYERAMQALASPKCFHGCHRCGCCDDGAFYEHFNPVTPDKNMDEVLENVANYKKKPAIQKALIELDIGDDYRYLAPNKIKLILRRAAFKAGMPIKDDFEFATDKIQILNWSYGYDVAMCRFYYKQFDTKAFLAKMNENLPEGVRVTSMRTYPSSLSGLRNTADSCLYEVVVPKPFEVIDANIAEILGKDQFIVKMKEKGASRGAIVNVDVDIRPYIKDIWATTLTPSQTRIRMLLTNEVGAYDVLVPVLKTTRRNAMHYPVNRINFFVDNDSQQDDMFIDNCEVCGAKIPTTIFDKCLDNSRCLRHMKD